MNVLPDADRPLAGLRRPRLQPVPVGPARVAEARRPRRAGDQDRASGQPAISAATSTCRDTDIDGDNSLFHAINRNKESLDRRPAGRRRPRDAARA